MAKIARTLLGLYVPTFIAETSAPLVPDSLAIGASVTFTWRSGPRPNELYAVSDEIRMQPSRTDFPYSTHYIDGTVTAVTSTTVQLQVGSRPISIFNPTLVADVFGNTAFKRWRNSYEHTYPPPPGGDFATGRDYRLRISRSGYNVLDNGLLANQLVFDSGWNEVLLTHGSGSAYIASGRTAGSLQEIASYASLGSTVRPYFILSVIPDSGNRQEVGNYRIRSTDTQLLMEMSVSNATGLTVKYWMFL